MDVASGEAPEPGPGAEAVSDRGLCHWQDPIPAECGSVVAVVFNAPRALIEQAVGYLFDELD